MDDSISRQEAIDALDELCDRECEYSKKQRSVMCGACHLGSAFDVIEQLPSAQIIRCKDCKNWAVQVKDVNGDGLGSCKFHKANFVTGEGYCYWAERREDEKAD